MLRRLEAGGSEVTAHFEAVPPKMFFNLLLQNTKEGFFCDPIHGGNKGMVGWTLIGFPGARADFMDWVQRPGEAYPLPTVTIAFGYGVLALVATAITLVFARNPSGA